MDEPKKKRRFYKKSCRQDLKKNRFQVFMLREEARHLHVYPQVILTQTSVWKTLR